MTGETGVDSSTGNSSWRQRDPLAWFTALAACVVLLGLIRYCPTYDVGKLTLIQMWVNTFGHDLSTQISGLFAAHSKETLAGEATSSEWNYCAMVPFIVAWLVWRLRPEFANTPVNGSPNGYGVLATGFLLYIVGFLMENYYIGMGAMEFIYAGLIILYLGWAYMRLLFFPWVFLMFMWPYNFMEDVATDLREYMSALSHYVLQFIDVPNILSGTSILSVHGASHPFAIDIADPCSGIRSLFALVMIAALFAAISFDKLWQQAIIIVLAVPMVFLGNLVRILILTVGTIHFGEAFALGTNNQPSWFHEGAGYLVYLINVGGLILAGTALGKFTNPQPSHART